MEVVQGNSWPKERDTSDPRSRETALLQQELQSFGLAGFPLVTCHPSQTVLNHGSVHHG